MDLRPVRPFRKGKIEKECDSPFPLHAVGQMKLVAVFHSQGENVAVVQSEVASCTDIVVGCFLLLNDYIRVADARSE